MNTTVVIAKRVRWWQFWRRYRAYRSAKEVIGKVLVITDGRGIGQARIITAFDPQTQTVTVDAWTTPPDGSSAFRVVSAPLERDR